MAYSYNKRIVYAKNRGLITSRYHYKSITHQNIRRRIQVEHIAVVTYIPMTSYAYIFSLHIQIIAVIYASSVNTAVFKGT